MVSPLCAKRFGRVMVVEKSWLKSLLACSSFLIEIRAQKWTRFFHFFHFSEPSISDILFLYSTKMILCLTGKLCCFTGIVLWLFPDEPAHSVAYGLLGRE